MVVQAAYTSRTRNLRTLPSPLELTRLTRLSFLVKSCPQSTDQLPKELSVRFHFDSDKWYYVSLINCDTLHNAVGFVGNWQPTDMAVINEGLVGK